MDTEPSTRRGPAQGDVVDADSWERDASGAAAALVQEIGYDVPDPELFTFGDEDTVSDGAAKVRDLT